VKFTPNGGRIQVRAEALDGQVQIEVEDTGPGIDPSHVPHLFQAFYQAPETAAKGSGLGLNIVDAIARAHGGGVSVESTLGRGSTFILALPAPA
jgi:signal transduction histidine kinase